MKQSFGGEASGFKGNKRDLPSKLCQACGRTMTWRKRWARTWHEVKFCSDACRSGKAPAAQRARSSAGS